MTIYTSYYAACTNKTRTIDGVEFQTISISVKAPWFWKPGKLPEKHYEKLAPTWEIVNDYKNGKIDERGYTERFFELLLETRKLKAERVIEELPENVVLLCYEKPETFCHRRLVAKWIEHETGIVVPEVEQLDRGGNVRKPKPVDGLLSF